MGIEEALDGLGLLIREKRHFHTDWRKKYIKQYIKIEMRGLREYKDY